MVLSQGVALGWYARPRWGRCARVRWNGVLARRVAFRPSCVDRAPARIFGHGAPRVAAVGFDKRIVGKREPPFEPDRARPIRQVRAYVAAGARNAWPAGSLDTLRIPRKLDSRSTANWTPVPPQTGRLFQVKLDRRSEAPRGGDAVYAVMGPAVNARWRVPVLVGVGRGPSGGRRNVEKVDCCCAAGVLSQRCGPRGAVWAKGE